MGQDDLNVTKILQNIEILAFKWHNILTLHFWFYGQGFGDMNTNKFSTLH